MPAVFGLTTPAFVLSAFDLEPGYSPIAALLRTVLSNATATLLVAPVVLLWLQYGIGRVAELSERRLGEAAAVMLALLAVGIVTFATGPEVARFPSLPLLVVPPLLWAAVRFGPLGASTSLFLVAAVSIWGTARQFGPFVLGADTDQVLALQLFWIVLCPPVMLLAAVIREHEQAEDTLQDQRNQLAHVTRVATVGELSGALAHELRQPLTSILSNAQAGLRLLAQHPVDLQELREILEDITQQDQQAAGVIARVRSFLQEGDSTFETLAVDGVVRDALKLGRSTIEESGVAVHAQIPTNLPGVRGDRVQLLQVVLNLIVNGCESMSAIPAPNRRLQLVASRTDEAHVEVAVRDRGVGLPYGGEGRVFEPFFTTKPKGLGLGLSIGRSIAAAHGGQLWGENNPRRRRHVSSRAPDRHPTGGRQVCPLLRIELNLQRSCDRAQLAEVERSFGAIEDFATRLTRGLRLVQRRPARPGPVRGRRPAVAVRTSSRRSSSRRCATGRRASRRSIG